MKQTLYLKEFEALSKHELALTSRKNRDYANEDDAFANFRLIETLTDGKITAEMGMVVRMSDKLQRIANLVFRDNQVLDEKIEDTLFDLGIYSKIFRIYLQNKNEK